MAEYDVEVRNARWAVAKELEKKKVLHQPIARFDFKTGQVYMEYSDGSKNILGNAMLRGRYSERKQAEA